MHQEDELEMVLSQCSSGISYGSMPILRLYSVSSGDQELYKRIHHKFLRAPEIYSSILLIVQKLEEKTHLDQDLMLLLLHKYKWNVERLEEGYFTSENQEYYDQRLTAKNQNHLLEAWGECVVCQHHQRLLASSCGHKACVECWREYIMAQLEGKAFFKCIEEECQEVLYHSFVVRTLQNKGKYLRNLALEYAQSVKTICACPGADCQLFFEDTSLLVRSVLCECGTRYCFKCLGEPHEPCSCKEVEEWTHLTKSEKPNEAWIKCNTKVCPGCNNPIERALGCNLMACKCGVHFCYNCSQPWDQDHKDHFICPNEIVKKKSTEAIPNITLQYSTFVVSNGFEKNAEKEAKESDQLRKRIVTKLQICESDTLFLKLLSDMVVRGHSYIKWTEVLQYLRHATTTHVDLLELNLEKLRAQMRKCGSLLMKFKKKMELLVQEESGMLLQTKGVTLKEFYKEKEQIECNLKHTESFMIQFLSDMNNL